MNRTRKSSARRTAPPQEISELRLRVGGVEIRVTGESREDCLQQLLAAAQEVEREDPPRYRLTRKGEAALAGEGVA